MTTFLALWCLVGLAVAIAFGAAARRMRRDRARALPRPAAVLPFRAHAHGSTRC